MCGATGPLLPVPLPLQTCWLHPSCNHYLYTASLSFVHSRLPSQTWDMEAILTALARHSVDPEVCDVVGVTVMGEHDSAVTVEGLSAVLIEGSVPSATALRVWKELTQVC